MMIGLSPGKIHLKYRDGRRNEGKRPRKTKPRFKRWKLDDLVAALWANLLERETDARFFFAEDLSDIFFAEKADIHRALQVLRTKGFSFRKSNKPPHDIHRNYYQLSSGWRGTVYSYVPPR